MQRSIVSQIINPINVADEIISKANGFKSFGFRIVERDEDIALAESILMAAHNSRDSLIIDFPPAQKKFSSESIVFILEENHKPVGTFSLIFDSSSGLPADITFSDEMNLHRESSVSISEICSLGVMHSCILKRDMMLYIIYIATLQNFYLNISDCVITVKNTHNQFYNDLCFKNLSIQKISQRTQKKVNLLSISNKDAASALGVSLNTFRVKKLDGPNSYWRYINKNINQQFVDKTIAILKDKTILIEIEVGAFN